MQPTATSATAAASFSLVAFPEKEAAFQAVAAAFARAVQLRVRRKKWKKRGMESEKRKSLGLVNKRVDSTKKRQRNKNISRCFEPSVSPPQTTPLK
jgi:hypothetical protein